MRGFLLGKFMPPHLGHVHLCHFARAYADDLTILVGSLPDDPIPGALRAGWMRALFPDCDVVHQADPVPQAPDEHPDFWPIWRDLIRRLEPRRIDLVFASEPYGLRLAEELGARFVTSHVPEYARPYTEVFGTECGAEDLRRIARGQRAAEAAALRRCNRVLFADTDAVLTAVWAEMLLGRRLPALEAAPLADLYLLLDVDLAWADDGTRHFPDPARRRVFLEVCRAALQRRGAAYRLVAGQGEDRLRTCIAAVTAAFPDLAPSR